MKKETISKEINNKVISKKDIRYLWGLIEDNYKEITSEHKNKEIEISAFDNTRYESDGDHYIKDGDIIDQKKINSIELSFVDYRNDLRIRINLNSKLEEIKYNVSGQNSNWVLGVSNKIDNILNSTKPQNTFLKRYEFLIFVSIFAYFLYSLFFLYRSLVDFINNYNFIGEAGLSALSYVLGSLFLFIIFPLSLDVIKKISKLWPSVEFDFGPEHEKKEKNFRNKIIFIIVNLLLPIIISLLLNYF